MLLQSLLLLAVLTRIAAEAAPITTAVQPIVKAPFRDPRTGGGSWLTSVKEGSGGREPLNVVISAQSDPAVLTRSGLEDWLNSIGYADECLGLKGGGPQRADLGDGRGALDQFGLYRWAFAGLGAIGTCWESLVGGSHVRFWPQEADEGGSAWFLAASNEHSIQLRHAIIDPDGYDDGRDDVVGNATVKGGTTSPFSGIVYSATSESLSGFLEPGILIAGVQINHEVAIDGQIAVLTIAIDNREGFESFRIAFLPSLIALLVASLLGLVFSYVLLRPIRYATAPPSRYNPRDIHIRRHQQLLLALNQIRRDGG